MELPRQVSQPSRSRQTGRGVRLSMSLAVIAAVGATSAPLAHRASNRTGDAGTPTRYTVLIKEAASRSSVLADIVRAGGTVVTENAAIGALTVVASDARFAARLSRSSAIVGAAPNRPIGRVPRQRAVELERPRRTVASSAVVAGGSGVPDQENPDQDDQAGRMDPFDDGQWGLKMVRSHVARDRSAGRRTRARRPPPRDAAAAVRTPYCPVGRPTSGGALVVIQ
jgi:hypothetical protein